MPESDVKPGYPENKSPVFTDTALGIFRASKGGWFVAKIRYNPETGETSQIEKVHAGDEKGIAIERFKITAVFEKLI